MTDLLLVSLFCTSLLHTYQPGLIPRPVNLSMDMNPHEPSLTLSWEKPDNIWNAKEMVAYDIHFKSSEMDEYEEMSEDCYATAFTFTRRSGLVPLTTYEFKIRARSEDGEGEWRTVSTIFGKMGTLLYNDVICLAITRVQYMSWYLICQSVFCLLLKLAYYNGTKASTVCPVEF